MRYTLKRAGDRMDRSIAADKDLGPATVRPTAASVRVNGASNRLRFLGINVDRVIIHADSVETLIRTDRFFQALDGKPSRDSARYQARFSLFCPFQCVARRQAVGMMVSNKPDSEQSQKLEIFKAIAQALT